MKNKRVPARSKAGGWYIRIRTWVLCIHTASLVLISSIRPVIERPTAVGPVLRIILTANGSTKNRFYFIKYFLPRDGQTGKRLNKTELQLRRDTRKFYWIIRLVMGDCGRREIVLIYRKHCCNCISTYFTIEYRTIVSAESCASYYTLCYIGIRLALRLCIIIRPRIIFAYAIAYYNCLFFFTGYAYFIDS